MRASDDVKDSQLVIPMTESAKTPKTDAQELITPSELTPDEQWARNGEYVSADFARQLEGELDEALQLNEAWRLADLKTDAALASMTAERDDLEPRNRMLEASIGEWQEDCQSAEAERDRLRDEVANATKCCDSYAVENQQLSDRAARAEAELAECRKDAQEKDGYNVGLAAEVHTIRNVLDDLVDALEATADMDEMDGPEYAEASKKLDEAIANAKPHTEKAITQAAIDMAAQGEKT